MDQVVADSRIQVGSLVEAGTQARNLAEVGILVEVLVEEEHSL